MTAVPMPETVMFDWDGTLVDTFEGIYRAHNSVRVAFGLPLWSEAEFHKVMHHSTREIYPVLYGDRAEEAIKILNSHFDSCDRDYINPLPEAESFVKFLLSRNVSVGVVSNKRHEVLHKEIEHLGWGKYFFGIIGAGYAKRDKPAADPLLACLSVASLVPHEQNVWYVGDTETDMLAATAAGCAPVLVLYGQEKAELIKKYKPYLVAHDGLGLKNAILA